MKISKATSFLVIALVLIAIPFSLTAKPKSCATCHEMKAFYESWDRSVHNKWGCSTCHQRPGIIGYMAFKAGFILEASASVLNINDMKNPGAREPNNDSCLGSGCHSLNREVGPDAAIKISHRIHITKTKYRCIDCHRKVVHDNMEGAGYATPYRELCVKCHKAQMKNCEYCHRRLNTSEYPNFKH